MTIKSRTGDRVRRKIKQQPQPNQERRNSEIGPPWRSRTQIHLNSKRLLHLVSFQEAPLSFAEIELQPVEFHENPDDSCFHWNKLSCYRCQETQNLQKSERTTPIIPLWANWRKKVLWSAKILIILTGHFTSSWRSAQYQRMMICRLEVHGNRPSSRCPVSS